MTTRADANTGIGSAVSAAVSALTPEQIVIVNTRAGAVPPRWRDRFLRAVVDKLAMTRSPTDKDVVAACAEARRFLAIGIGPPSM